MGTWLSDEKRLNVLAALVDGNSERAATRLTGVARETVSKLALAFGRGATRVHDRLVHDVRCSLCDLDEQWSWAYVKEARVDIKKHNPAVVGDQWTWTAMDRTSRLVIAWHVGKRDEAGANVVVADVRSRVATMPQFSSDGLALYEQPIAVHFGPGSDYGQMVKNYRGGPRRSPDHRYEPPRDPFITKKTVLGAPDMDKCTTFALERQNGTMRHFVGRMRRLTYAFSKDVEHHKAAVGLCYTYYNFCWIPRTLRVTPAMQAGLAKAPWELGDFMEKILSEPEGAKPKPKPLAARPPRGPARPLPEGRGFLRLVGSAGAPAAPAPTVAASAGPTAANPTATRQERGALLAHEKADAFRKIAGHRYFVPSATSSGGYEVDMTAGTCTCDDYKKRQQPCKHFWALQQIVLAQAEEEPATAPTPSGPTATRGLSECWIDFSEDPDR